ncbi:hypothetical protein R5R35_004137 [Gryllus longicercus]|uniref:Uncharacterized protein n=1 Tax=Gryllus longicercus TaxID=2509291 RepID=A0AAN9YYW5_9ORTH
MSEVGEQQLQEPPPPPPPLPPPPSPTSTPPPPSSPDGSDMDGVQEQEPPPPPLSVFHWSSSGGEEEEEAGDKTRRKRRKNTQKGSACTTQCDLHCKTKPKRISSLNRKPTDKRRVIRGRLLQQQQQSLTGDVVNVTQCARNAAEWLARAVVTLCNDNKIIIVVLKSTCQMQCIPSNH